MREVVIPCERVCVIFLPKIAELVCYDKVRLFLAVLFNPITA
jgi:hypothetical protein